jgi:hypothetical protein
MTVYCCSFGSVWWLRPGIGGDEMARYSSRAAIFNTTGFMSGSRMRRLWMIAGVVRINVGMHQDARNEQAFMGRTFESAGLEHRGGWNRLLLGGRSMKRRKEHFLLIRADSDCVGRIDFGEQWHSQGVGIAAASARRGVQETLLLMKPGATITTGKGVWEATWDSLELR